MKKLLFYIFLTSCLNMIGQPFARKSLTVADGLPSNNVNVITHDSNGYIWIGTREGLARYDGERIVDFTRHADSMGKHLSSNVGLLAFDNDTDQLWIQTEDVDKECLDLASYRYLDNDTVSTKFLRWADVSRPATDGYSFEQGPNTTLVITAPDSTRTELRLIPDDNRSFNRNNRYSVAKSGENLFIATYGAGLFIYNLADKSLQQFSAADRDPIISTNYLTHCHIDNFGRIWISTEGEGVTMLAQPTTVDIITQTQPFPDSRHGDGRNYIITLNSSGDDSGIIAGTRLGYSFLINSSSLQAIPGKKLNYLANRCITDSKGRRWTALSDGVIVDNRIFSSIKTHSLFPNQANNIRDLAEDSGDRIWAASNGGLRLFRIEKDSLVEKAVLLDDKTNTSRSFALAANGNRLFIGTRGGLFILDTGFDGYPSKAELEKRLTNVNLPLSEIMDIETDGDSVVWLAAKGGVLRLAFDSNLNNPSVRTINTDSGLTSNLATALKKIADDYILVATEHGASIINTNTLLAVGFVFPDHMSNNVLSSIVALGESQWLMGTSSGLLKFDLNKFAKYASSSLHTPAVSEISVNGNPVYDVRNGAKKLTHTTETIEFKFANTGPHDGYEILYQFYLEGKDADWRDPSKSTSASYDNLDPGNYKFHLRQVNANGEWSDEAVYDVVITQPWWNTWRAWLIYIAAVAAAVLFTFRNMRHRIRMKRQIHEMELAEKVKNEFFTSVTHEFRTPLAIIDGAARQVVDGNGTVSKSNLQTINRTVKRLLRLVNQLLDFRKLDTGNYRLKLREIDIAAFVRDIFSDFKIMAEQKGISINMTTFAKSYKIFSDARIVETVVYNLLSNACKYTPAGGCVTLAVKQPEDGMLCIKVTDNGKGIAPEKRDNLFTPFMHGMASEGGMGIGLYNSRRLASIHLGDLSYEPREDKGSVFTLTLPVNSEVYKDADFSDEPSTPAAAVSPEDTHHILRELKAEALNDRTVAIVEDDPDMYTQIANVIGEYFHTVHYKNCAEALDGLRQQPPALIICDAMLPDGNGFDIVKTIRPTRELHDVPVIMLTALADETSIMRGYKAGADEYMGKPCDFRLLVLRAFQLIKWYDEKRSAIQETKSSAQNAQLHTQNVSGPDIMLTSTADRTFLRRLESLVKENIEDPDFTIDKAAEMMRIGRTSFFGKIKELTGLTPGKYINDARMKIAAGLITDGSMSVAEICYKVGISDPSYFTRLFKSHFGVSPTQYRKQM